MNILDLQLVFVPFVLQQEIKIERKKNETQSKLNNIMFNKTRNIKLF